MRTDTTTKVLFGVFCVVLLMCVAALAGPRSGKPMLPITVKIEPALPGITGDSLQPGDVVEFIVTATALDEAKELRLEAKLLGGAEFVTGTQAWSGPAGKGEKKQIFVTLRVPDTGRGKIQAVATLLREGKRTVHDTAQYVLGGDATAKNKPKGKLKKDSKGRDIIEY